MLLYYEAYSIVIIFQIKKKKAKVGCVSYIKVCGNL
jgi:hypothetical protein